jgi:hypothetical protein
MAAERSPRRDCPTTSRSWSGPGATCASTARPRRGGPGSRAARGCGDSRYRELAAAGEARWRRARVSLCGQEETLELCSQQGLWWKAWRDAPAKAVAIRDRRAQDQIRLVVITSDPQLADRRIVELYAKRWSIEVAFRDAKQLVGVGEAQNRTRLAVELTSPFAFLCLTVAIVWYALQGHAPTDIGERCRRSPWYRTKRQPSVEDMLVKLRRTLIAARLSASIDPQARDRKLADIAEAWEMAAA